MNNIWMLLFLCLCCFIWGFASNYKQWSKRAEKGDLVEIKGKIYKIVEVDVIERGANDHRD